MNDQKQFVCVDDYGLKGVNYYWVKREQFGLSKDELKNADVFGPELYVHKDIIAPLQHVDADFRKDEYSLFVKEGYRPKKLYELIYRKRAAKFGKEITDKLVNMNTMPHASGKSVDVTLWDLKTDKELYLRDRKDDPEAFFLDFYRDKPDKQSKRFQQLQDLLRRTMERHGFSIGVKNEYLGTI